MPEIVEVLLDALLDTVKLAPLLLVAHVLIEVFEYHAASKIKMNKVLRGPLAPLIGGAVGIIPQCGFSVVAANLYAKRHIRLGTLLAVFVATSDEAVPILLSSPQTALKLLPLLGCKLVFAVGIGYLINGFTHKQSLLAVGADDSTVPHGCHGHEIGEHTHTAADRSGPKQPSAQAEGAAVTADESTAPEKKKFDWECFVVHPLVHTLTVLGFILLVNVLLGIVLYFVGEARLASFMSSARYLQPFLAALVGLVPNCASSVVITQLYASGTLTLGAAFAGLSVNAGLGIAVLIKENKNARENLWIVLGLYVGSCLVGLLLSLLPL